MSNCVGGLFELGLPEEAIAQHVVQVVIILRMTATMMTLGFLPGAARRSRKL